MSRFVFSVLVALSLAACGAEPSGTDEMAGMDHAASGHETMDHAAMDHTAEAAPADADPLPDDGVTPIIEVRAAWIRPHPQGRDVTAAYFAARLTQGAGDRLLEARIEGASAVELHSHTMDEQGVMRMRQIGAQFLGTEGPLVFTPGGRHLMVFGLAPVVEGDTVDGVLVFERAGEVPVRFAVRSMPPGMPTDY